jgi:Na+/H+ antiporter NhaC
MAVFLKPLLILILSWSFTDVMQQLGTDLFFVDSLRFMRPEAIPALVFIVSSVLSFCSGTSWGTLGVMFKLCLPLCVKVRGDTTRLLIGSISAIIGGAVFGDHWYALLCYMFLVSCLTKYFD